MARAASSTCSIRCWANRRARGWPAKLGAETAECDKLVVDDHQRTTVPGLYAIGDVVRGLNQIAVAAGQAAIAATAIHNALPWALRPKKTA
jgi:thioredoxin reductase (NADPH)